MTERVTEAGLPERIGPYRVKRLIASGGMGVVYEAEQDSPRRSVALKVLRDLGASREALRRFEYEIEILGLLRHPRIAQVYEAGTYRDGSQTLPFFAMEYVADARSLTDFAAQRGLGRRQRLELYLEVLEAVGHGHQKGVIHRDLKPANLLVDAQGHVKVIDFGVARAAHVDAEKRSLLTQVGQLVGTVQYMSPEQIDADPGKVDTRSDVYSLGVVLYELLAGRYPHDFSKVTLDEATRLIREQPPTRLSVADRGLRGDLETIVSKALEKERERRYASVEELRRDVRAYLDGAAISARPPSVSYQLRVLARRHRAFVGGVAAVFVALLAGVVVSSSLYLRAERERREADEQAAIARAVNAFLNEDLLEAVDPRNTADREVTMRAVLDQAAKRIGDRFGDTPLVEAAIRRSIGKTYLGLALADAAEEHVLRAHELLAKARGERHRETLAAANTVAVLRQAQGRQAEAEQRFRELRELELAELGPEADETLETASGFGYLLALQGRFDEAEPLLRAAADGWLRAHGLADERTLQARIVLGVLLADMSRLGEAEALYRETLDAAREHLGPEHPLTLAGISNFSQALVLAKRPAEAVELLAPALEIDRRVFGETHAETLAAVNNLAVAYRRMGELDLAVPLYLESFEASARTLGEEHPDTLVSAVNLGATYVELGDFEQAAELLERTVEISRRVLEPGFYGTGFALSAYGEALLGLGLHDDAESALLEARDVLVAVFGPRHPNSARPSAALARLYRETGRDQEAAEAQAAGDAAAAAGR